MSLFVSEIFTTYTNSLSDIFSNTNKSLLLLLFSIVLLTMIFKFIVKRRC